MATIKERIVSVLKRYPKGIKAIVIASKLGITRTEVNSFLYSHKSDYSVDENYMWTIKIKNSQSNKADSKIKDEWHDTSNVRAINAELKRQRLERKNQEEQIIILKPIEEEEDEGFDLTEFLENHKSNLSTYPFFSGRRT